MKNYEYQRIKHVGLVEDSTLNSFGVDGWRLVAVSKRSAKQSPDFSNPASKDIYDLYFERKLEKEFVGKGPLLQWPVELVAAGSPN